MYRNIKQKNDMCVHHFISIGSNGNLLGSKLKERAKYLRTSLTVPHFQACTQDIAINSTHGERFHIMGGTHTTKYDVFRCYEFYNKKKEE